MTSKTLGILGGICIALFGVLTIIYAASIEYGGLLIMIGVGIFLVGVQFVLGLHRMKE